MAKVDELALAVRKRWLSEGVFDREVTSSEVCQLEERVGRLPSAYKSLLLIGGAQADTDEEGVFFWPPEDIQPLHELLADHGYELEEGEQAIVIADYLQESWWYGLWTSGSKTGEVFIALGDQFEKPQRSIGDVEGFLTAYLSRSSALYPPEKISNNKPK